MIAMTTTAMSRPRAPMAVKSSSGMWLLLAGQLALDNDSVALNAGDFNRRPGVDEAAVRHDVDANAVDRCNTCRPQRRQGRARPSQQSTVAFRSRDVAAIRRDAGVEHEVSTERQLRKDTQQRQGTSHRQQDR